MVLAQPPGPVNIDDIPFDQEYHVPLPIAGTDSCNDVRALTWDDKGDLWAATGAGIYRYDVTNRKWNAKLAKVPGPAFTLAMDHDKRLWFGNWDGLFQLSSDGVVHKMDIHEPVTALLTLHDRLLAFSPAGVWQVKNNRAEQVNLPIAHSIRSVQQDQENGYFIATDCGLFHQSEEKLQLYQQEPELISAAVTDIAYDHKNRLWIAGLGGITLYQNERRIGQLTPSEGLASVNIQCLQCAPDGIMWIGTRDGIIRYNGQTWSMRHSRRWLLGNDVRDIIFDQQGAAWVATSAGVSVIAKKTMTLKQKADHFQRILQSRHIRSPYLVEKCRLSTPGDTLTWAPYDDDNDGQYTSMYLAMESFRYAASKNPQARENARQAFAALRFLQSVTNTNGFVARTVIPANWTRMADPNRTLSEQEWAEQRRANPREKRVEKMWRLSQDGKWLWKGDTSSDEITGHMYGYLVFYDLAADAQDKNKVKEHVCRIVDYIVQNGFALQDIDGRHTQWGVWTPQRLNHDPDWSPERGINTIEILSYVKLAYHVSREARYQRLYLELLQKHDMQKNIVKAKTYNPAWITHIDDELLALAYPCLLLHETEQKWLDLYRASLDHWFAGAEKDASPFFNFTYAALSHTAPRLQESIFFLRDTPLDLIRWRIDNSLRFDIQLGYFREFENLHMNRLLPISERSFFRWDNNPWYPIEGDGGVTESDGVFWLLPYWMGRYYGFIQ